MSYQSSLNTIEKLSEDHDVEVQFWCDEMKEARRYVVIQNLSTNEPLKTND